MKDKKEAALEVQIQEQEIININKMRIENGLKPIDDADRYLILIKSKTMLLENLLGNEITIFVTEKRPNFYEVEVVDTNNRTKLLVMNLTRLSKFRYCLLKYGEKSNKER